MDDLARQRELRQLRDEVLSTPNCPECLHRMEPATVDDVPVWRCARCGATRSA
ncbi:zf-TFIIB domain-containing protein [Microbacterium sp.]|uniref:TFIIB-type zinc ribbon-containing protein n=1 Tax=Microbacterium sp. TaxID=51671 RepID=UPI0039E2543D